MTAALVHRLELAAGADLAIDYRREDFAERLKDWRR